MIKKAAILVLSVGWLIFFSLPVLAVDPLLNRAEIEARIQEKEQELVQKREEFRQRLEGIRDEHKQKIVGNLDASYSRINQRWITHFNNVLDRLEAILDRLKTRAAGQYADKFVEAEQLLAAAREKIAVQAAKIYTIEITDEASLRGDVQAVHQQLRTDLTTLRAEVKAARDALHDILKIMAESEGSPEAEKANTVRQSVSTTSKDGNASATAESVVIIE